MNRGCLTAPLVHLRLLPRLSGQQPATPRTPKRPHGIVAGTPSPCQLLAPPARLPTHQLAAVGMVITGSASTQANQALTGAERTPEGSSTAVHAKATR